jgi:RNA polymerase sigma-70 factor (sigma-E family)
VQSLSDHSETARPERVDFDAFVAVRGPALLRLSLALTGSRPEAEDLLQDALARCFVRWRRVSILGNVEGYVRRVIVHQHISRHRRRVFRYVALDAGPGREVPIADAADGVVARVTIQAALRQLPPQQRVVVVLTYYEDLPDAQIAEALDCAVNTVKSNRAKALASLRRSREVATIHD